ncbi:unnamed protein product [Gongylonema pulchrum]|uniref:C2H2-type domain-containing protein n=1 Tax=Gongylonema pulchrum TaxID=637853 RepID=A0A183EVZ7_9BILA|nr:unnamed protein product [Gongylonema pulchrum]
MHLFKDELEEPPKLLPENDDPAKPSTPTNPAFSAVTQEEYSVDGAALSTADEPRSAAEKSDFPENTRTIEGPGGLKLFVSIEKESGRRNGVVIEDAVLDNSFEICPQTFGSPALSGKVSGVLTNVDDEQFRPKMECPMCGLVLYRHNFSTHYRIHTGELPFLCTCCQKRFRTSSALKVHVR